MKKYLYFIFVSLIFIACTPKFDNPNISNPEIKRQKLKHDSIQCKMLAYKQLPDSYVPYQNSSGHFTLTNINTGAKYEGSYTSDNNFNSGLANGLNFGTSLRKDILRKEYYISCMESKGWKHIK